MKNRGGSMKMKNKELIAVYGTLRKKGHNDHYLRDVTRVKHKTTKRLEGFELYLWSGSTPTAKRGKGSVVFEFYEVDKTVFKSIKDMEEGCYIPYKTKVLYLKDNTKVWIWLQDEKSNVFKNKHKIEHGDFIRNQFEKNVKYFENNVKQAKQSLVTVKNRLIDYNNSFKDTIDTKR